MSGFWNKNKDVTIQDSTSVLFQYFLMREIKTDITLTSDVSVDDVIINVSSGHGFVIGECLVVWEENKFEQCEVKNVAVDAITVCLPVANSFSALNSVVIRGDSDLTVNGSVTPVDFVFKMYNSIIPIDINRAVITLQHGINVPDDGKFGGIAALANGIYFRQRNGITTNLGIYQKNQDFRERGAGVEYTDKAPAGTYGTNIFFDIKESFGQVVRINPRNNDYVLVKVQDNLSSLDYFKISLIGSYTEGE